MIFKFFAYIILNILPCLYVVVVRAFKVVLVEVVRGGDVDDVDTIGTEFILLVVPPEKFLHLKNS